MKEEALHKTAVPRETILCCGKKHGVVGRDGGMQTLHTVKLDTRLVARDVLITYSVFFCCLYLSLQSHHSRLLVKGERLLLAHQAC